MDSLELATDTQFNIDTRDEVAFLAPFPTTFTLKDSQQDTVEIFSKMWCTRAKQNLRKRDFLKQQNML